MKTYNKSDLVLKLAEELNLSKADAERNINAIVSVLSNMLINGDSINIRNFGKFEVIESAARTGRNPQTGEVINIPVRKRVRFKAGTSLKQAVREK